MKGLFLVLGLWSMVPSPSLAQSPSLNLPPVPTQSLTVVFKNVVHQDQVRLVLESLKSSKRTEVFVMKRAQRGMIEYGGRYFGEANSLLDLLQQSVQDKLKLESKQKSDGDLEITVTPQSS